MRRGNRLTINEEGVSHKLGNAFLHFDNAVMAWR